ncbi:MAG: hypothetical protein FWF81_04200 [Defluviitaleaceae bacterium]|nr:hypothetical protein [Defluviitaleaceae bacterium]
MITNHKKRVKLAVFFSALIFFGVILGAIITVAGRSDAHENFDPIPLSVISGGEYRASIRRNALDEIGELAFNQGYNFLLDDENMAFRNCPKIT